MSKTYKTDEYFKKFGTEKIELIVRVDWCQQKGSTGFGMIDDCRIKRVRFKCVHKLEVGKMYHVLVRDNLSEQQDKARCYYLEKVIESDVTEPLLDSLYLFERKFEEKKSEITLLIKNSMYGLADNGRYRVNRVGFIAYIDGETNELNNTYGELSWMEENRKQKIKSNFENMGIYKVRVRKNKESDSCFMLTDILGKAKDDRLEKIKENYLKPVVINHSLGKFVLNRNKNLFEGKIDYLGEKCMISLEVNDGETTADRQLNKLSEIYGDIVKWDNKVREFTADELLKLANNEWNDGENDITKSEFMQRIGIPWITVYADGNIELDFDSDGMFTDHGIVININEKGELIDAEIVG